MSAPYIPETGTAYESIIFRRDNVEISFTERHDRGDGVALVRTLILDGPRKCPAEFEEFMEALQNLVDAGQLALRNPPERIR